MFQFSILLVLQLVADEKKFIVTSAPSHLFPHHFDTGGKEPDLRERKNGAGCALPAAHFERDEAQGI